MPRNWIALFVAAVLVILGFTVFGDRGLLHINHLERERSQLQREIAAVQAENERLRREIEALRSSREYIETIARREFGLIRPGEVIYRFMTSSTRKTPDQPDETRSIPLKRGAVQN